MYVVDVTCTFEIQPYIYDPESDGVVRMVILLVLFMYVNPDQCIKLVSWYES